MSIFDRWFRGQNDTPMLEQNLGEEEHLREMSFGSPDPELPLLPDDVIGGPESGGQLAPSRVLTPETSPQISTETDPVDGMDELLSMMSQSSGEAAALEAQGNVYRFPDAPASTPVTDKKWLNFFRDEDPIPSAPRTMAELESALADFPDPTERRPLARVVILKKPGAQFARTQLGTVLRRVNQKNYQE